MTKGIKITTKRDADGNAVHRIGLAPRHTLPDERLDKSKPGVTKFRQAREVNGELLPPYFAIVDDPAVSS